MLRMRVEPTHRRVDIRPHPQIRAVHMDLCRIRGFAFHPCAVLVGAHFITERAHGADQQRRSPASEGQLVGDPVRGHDRVCISIGDPQALQHPHAVRRPRNPLRPRRTHVAPVDGLHLDEREIRDEIGRAVAARVENHDDPTAHRTLRLRSTHRHAHRVETGDDEQFFVVRGDHHRYLVDRVLFHYGRRITTARSRARPSARAAERTRRGGSPLRRSTTTP